MKSVLPHVAALKEVALNLLFPQHCIGCGKEGEIICRSCRDSLPVILPPLCSRCGRPQTGGALCPSCTVWQADIDGIRSPFRFEGIIRQAIHQMKYNNLRSLAAPLGELLYEYFSLNPLSGDAIVPVPLHNKRLKERGYNQSALLAGKLGKMTGLPVAEDCLVRQRRTPPQARTASVEERRRNVAGAFACRAGELPGKRIILIDDVCTSGATLNSCAAALKASGASEVWGLTLGREI